jgi:LPS-assembly protein
MKNNLHKYLIIIFFLSLLKPYAYSQDQFNFDITEVEILDNGNIYKGYKRGSINTNDGVSIDADKFDYNKTLNILNSYGNVLLYDSVKNFTIITQKATYFKDEEKIFTEGNSKAINENNITITADKFRYDKTENIFHAYGNVKINNPIKDYIIYAKEATYLKNEEKLFSKGKTKAIIKSQYIVDSEDVVFLVNESDLSSTKKTVINDQKSNFYYLEKFNFNINKDQLKGEDITAISNFGLPHSDQMHFSNAFINLQDKSFIAGKTFIKAHKEIFDDPKQDPRIKGISSIGDGNRTTIKKGVFTSCANNEKCPPWSIVAQKIVHDKKEKQLIYDNAILKIYDFPVLYFPKFFHPDPTVKRQSGFLRPHMNDSSILGSSLYVPYFQVISDNKDITWRPTIFNVLGLTSKSSKSDDKIYMLQTEYRQQNKNSEFIADVGYTYGYKSQLVPIDDKNSQIHFFSKFSKDLDLSNFETSTVNAQFYKVNNDSYLKIFENSLSETTLNPANKNIMYSTAKLILDHKNYNFDTGIDMYEDLTEKKNSDRYSFVLPYYNFSKTFMVDDISGVFNFDSSGSNDLKKTNILTTDIANKLNYQSNSYVSNNGFTNNFRAYYSNSNKIAKNDTRIKNSPTIRVANIYEYSSSWPLSKETLNYSNTIIPKISYRINPSGMDDMSGSARRITANSVFNIDRLSTGETFEDGQSLTIGINYNKESLRIEDRSFQYSLATVLRDKESKKIPVSSTLNETQSNIFGTFNNSFNENFFLNYEFAVDNNFKKAPYNSITTQISINNFVSSFRFVEENNEVTDTNTISNSTTYKIDDSNHLTFNVRRNRKINLTEYYDLVYEYKNDCLIAGIKYRKTYYEDREVRPKEDVLLTLTIVPLTTYEHRNNSWDF